MGTPKRNTPQTPTFKVKSKIALCRSGGIGRRAGLKIQYLQKCVGSSPTFGTTKINRGPHMIKNTPLEWLSFLHDCADAADDLCKHYFNKAHLKVDQKSNQTPVTEADLAIEKEIRRISAATFPDLLIYAEEFGQCPDDAPQKLIIDPIDGTQNFVRGIPFVGTLLAIEENGEIVAGIASQAMTFERWSAAKGHGSYHVNPHLDAPKKIQVSPISDISQSQVFHSSIFGSEAKGSTTETFIKLLSKTKRQRGFGDYFAHVYVAQGVGEFAFDYNLKPWDIAPLKLIVEEAGGKYTDVNGTSSIYTGTIISSNNQFHDEIINTLNGK